MSQGSQLTIVVVAWMLGTLLFHTIWTSWLSLPYMGAGKFWVMTSLLFVVVMPPTRIKLTGILMQARHREV